MRAIMTQNTDPTMTIEIVGRDPETDTEVVVERIPDEIKVSSREMMYSQANEILVAHHYRPMGTWREHNHDGVHRIIVEPVAQVVHQQTPLPRTHITAEQMHRSFLIADLRDQEPSEADTMLTASKNLGLRALQACDKARAEASVGNRDYMKNHTYMRARAALDAHCEQLAHLLWVRKHHAAGGSPISEYPSAADAEKYLRSVVDKAQEIAETHLVKKGG